MTHRITGAKVLAFLNDHRLVATPEHYAFAYRYLLGDDANLSTSVAAIIDGGVRISPHQIEKLAATERLPSHATDTLAPHLDKIAATILEIIGVASQNAGNFGKELTLAAVELIGSDAERVRQVVARMISQAERAEAGLADMSRRIAVLRDDIIMATNTAQTLLSRDFIEAHLRKSLAALPSQLCFAVVTIDQFETIQHEHGPGVGESVVRAVTETMQDRCGQHRVGRWAPGALAVVFEGISIPEATALLSSARSVLSSRHMKARESDRPIGKVTFSARLIRARSGDAKALISAASRIAVSAQQSGGDVTPHGEGK